MRLQYLFFLFTIQIGYSHTVHSQTEEPPFLKISGEVKTELKLHMDELRKMARSTAFLKDRDGKEHSYTGVPLIDILNRAGITTGHELRGENLSKYVLVKCSDGYEVVFSLAELDTSFTERVVIIADKAGDEDLPANKGPFRLIVPGEKKPARSAFQVMELTVKYAKD